MSEIKVSVICSTYNQPHFLGLVLSTLRRQKFQGFELIITDDGSTQETTDLINDFKKKFSVPVHHIWQEDRGFRKSKIHNEAIRKSQGELLVFMDGDCAVTPNYVGDHYEIFRRHSQY